MPARQRGSIGPLFYGVLVYSDKGKFHSFGMWYGKGPGVDRFGLRLTSLAWSKATSRSTRHVEERHDSR